MFWTNLQIGKSKKVPALAHDAPAWDKMARRCVKEVPTILLPTNCSFEVLSCQTHFNNNTFCSETFLPEKLKFPFKAMATLLPKKS